MKWSERGEDGERESEKEVDSEKKSEVENWRERAIDKGWVDLDSDTNRIEKGESEEEND